MNLAQQLLQGKNKLNTNSFCLIVFFPPALRLMRSLKDWPDRFGCVLLGHNEVIALCVFIELNKVETTKELVTLRNRKLSLEAMQWAVINALRLSIPPNNYISCGDLWANIHYWSMHLFNQTYIKWTGSLHTSGSYFCMKETRCSEKSHINSRISDILQANGVTQI